MEWRESLEVVLGYWYAIWRYRWCALAVTWVLSVIGWSFVAALPDQYRSEATVYINADSMIKPLMKGLTLSSDSDERILQVSKTLLSRSNIERISKLSNLDLKVKSKHEYEALILHLEKRIHLHRDGRSNIFKISYEHKDPRVAKLVVQSVLDLFIEKTLSSKRMDSSVAHKFLNDRISDYEERLVDAEKKLADFKRTHIGSLPSRGLTYYDSLQNILEKKKEAEIALEVVSSRKDELQRQLNGEIPVFGLLGDQFVASSESEPKKVEFLKVKLSELRFKYTDHHPAIVALKRTIESLSRAPDDYIYSSDEASLDQNPVYQQIKIAYSEASADVAQIKTKIKALDQSAEELRGRVDEVIEVETELANLNRSYLLDKKRHQFLLERKESAKLADSLDHLEGVFDFRIVDPPFVPLMPIAPHRLKLSVGVLFFSLMVGVLFALAMSQLKGSFYDRWSVSKELDLPVLSVVPKMVLFSDADRKKSFIQFLFFLGAFLGLVLALFLYHFLIF